MSNARELFLNRKDVKRELVKLDIGDGAEIEVEVRAVSLLAADRVSKAMEKGGIEGVVHLLIEAVFDPETGKQLFTKADADRLKELTQPQVHPIVAAFNRVTAVPKDDAGKGSAVTPAA